MIQKVYDFLGLKKPFEIQIRSKTCKTATAKYWAMYTPKGRLSKHLIRVYLGNLQNPNERDLQTLIAHEFIHAWQEENRVNEIHGPEFQRMAKEVYNAFPRQVSRDIYDPELDK